MMDGMKGVMLLANDVTDDFLLYILYIYRRNGKMMQDVDTLKESKLLQFTGENITDPERPPIEEILGGFE